MLNWIVRNRTVWSFNCMYLQNVFPNRICKKQDLALNNNGGYAIKPNQTIGQINLWI